MRLWWVDGLFTKLFKYKSTDMKYILEYEYICRGYRGRPVSAMFRDIDIDIGLPFFLAYLCIKAIKKDIVFCTL